MNRYGLEDYAMSAYPTGDKRAWFSEAHLFLTSPAMLGISEKDCSSGVCGERLTGSSIGNTDTNHFYLNNSWYFLQLMLNSGQRHCGGDRCVHWGYFYQALSEQPHASKANTPYAGGRRLLIGVKAMEEHESGSEGFAYVNSDFQLSLDDPRAMAFWSDSRHPNRRRALEVALQVRWEKLGSFTVQKLLDMYSGHGQGGIFFPDQNYIIGTGSHGFQVGSASYWQWNDMLHLKNFNMHPAIVNAMGRFGLAMWPRNDWASRGFAPAGPAPGRPSLATTASGVTVSWPQVPGATSYNVHRATEPNGPWLSVALLRSGNTLTDKPAETGKTYYYAVSANTATTESALSQAAMIRY